MGANISGAVGVKTEIPAGVLTLGAKMLEDKPKMKSLGKKLTALAEEAEGGKVAVAEVKAAIEESKIKPADLLPIAKLCGKRSRNNFHSLTPMLTRKGHEDFVQWPDFEPTHTNIQALATKKVLCVGAGGLGCEILKNLALSGVKDITVIDLDTIDISNLNRQFLFRRKDVGKAKARCAAEFIESRCKGVKVAWHMKKIQEFDDKFYRQFALVVAGLDNVKARLWLNSKLYSLITYDEDGDPEPDSIIPLIDGGTEGFKGQSRFFFGPFTSCFECSAADIKAGPKFDLCTIASTPRIAEHCIAYALLVVWPLLISLKDAKTYEIQELKSKADGGHDAKAPNGVKLDKDDPEHMTWIYERAKERATEFKISGVTYNLTMQYVKNIIPAIASTNALVSAACTNEAIKYLTHAAPIFNNYFFYMGQAGTYTRTFEYKKNPDCFTCGSKAIKVAIDVSQTVAQLLYQIDEKYKLSSLALAHEDGKMIYSKGLHETFKDNLAKSLKSFVSQGEKTVQLILTAKKMGAQKPTNVPLYMNVVHGTTMQVE